MNDPKREPFVRVAEVHSLNYGVLLSDRMARGHYGPKTSMERFVEDLNAAFNKRLDEEIKKALEGFRERAAEIAFGFCDCLNDISDCAAIKAIRALPTEPEKPEVTS